MDATKVASLKRAFKAYLDGQRSVSTLHEARIFFDATKVQDSPSECLEQIIGSKAGLKAVRQSVRLSLDRNYVRDNLFPFLWFFSDSEVQALYDGTFLQQLIMVVVSPATAWNNIVKTYREDTILHGQIESQTFAWLCYQVISHPDKDLSDLVDGIMEALDEHSLFKSPWVETKFIGYQVQNALFARNAGKDGADLTFGQGGPGGRHDNDFENFREISIFPTPDELTSTLKPFLRTAGEVAETNDAHRASCHLDNQFRLYRADFLAELKEDISAVVDDKKQGRRRGEVLGGLSLQHTELAHSDPARNPAYALDVSFTSGLALPSKLDEDGRCNYLKTNPRVLGHLNLGVLFHDKKIIAFAFIQRRAENLALIPPVVSLRFVSGSDFINAVQALLKQPRLQFAVINTPYFAYEPVLDRLKDMKEVPLQHDLFMIEQPPNPDTQGFQPTASVKDFITRCRERAAEGRKIQIVDKFYQLDEAQAAALTFALENPLAVIQGPPGTGKSFVGALIIKVLLEQASPRILVVTYTNHSTNQMLEDLCEIGIDPSLMSRLGSRFKATAKTTDMCFESQVRSSGGGLRHGQWTRINSLKNDIIQLRGDLDSALKTLSHKISLTERLWFLEFDDNKQSHQAWAAFQPPPMDESFRAVGKDGKELRAQDNLAHWRQGKKPGPFQAQLSQERKSVWDLSLDARIQLWTKWDNALRENQIEAVKNLASRIEGMQKEIDTAFNQSKYAFAATRRIIGCTTTSAAKNTDLIKAFRPTCILVEEAGEILEPHVLAALCPSTQQLVLIGDHKQLRPKCNSYALSVEHGDGYDLNRSMFERLILQGRRHETLQKQHRMAPEISQFVRSLTYPDLLDGDKTLDRPRIQGICSRVMFINLSMPEDAVSQIGDRRDPGNKGSKENKFEAEMVLKVVKYLGQQGYKSSDIVVLTPYLGQLRLLRDMLSMENDPVLNDLDSAELLRAGLLTQASANLEKSQIKLSSIDNFQGEESNIVVASLTRSNKRGDIGFMKEPERLNVLISRARNCLIMIGNMETFMKAPTGQKVWRPFFTQLKDNDFLHDGLRVRCERHTDQTTTLSVPSDFTEHCPEGGCNQTCDAALSCGIHNCERKCHLLSDHSKVSCNIMVKMNCEKGHAHSRKCSDKTAIICDVLVKMQCGKKHQYSKKCCDKRHGCPVCEEHEADLRRRVKRDLDLEKARLTRQENYRQELQQIKDEIARHERETELKDEEKQEAKSILVHRSKLEALRRAKKLSEASEGSSGDSEKQGSNTTGEAPGNEFSDGSNTTKSPARDEWESSKRNEFAKSTELDTLMSMIGLEGVKRIFLDIKSQIDVTTLQGLSVAKDRFGCTLLGNPGTGKTTVARIYGRFLTSMGALPGNAFEETTGSKLANMGVNGCQKMIDGVLNRGGGVIFIDEAYQLSSGNNPGGAAVLDFLLAEVENLRSQIVFILAGYAKQMESFFSHNPGFPSRFPLEMKFEDYSDEELRNIAARQINKRFRGRMKVEDGIHGLYCRILSRRLGRGRGKEGFGNARAVENALAKIYRNQARRIKTERNQTGQQGTSPGPAPDPLQLTKEDVIGPQPSKALFRSNAWGALQDLVGLQSVKESVQVLVDTLEANYERELVEKPIVEYSLNRVFLGNPGTGKTTVAKLYGELLAQIGILSNGEVVVKSPADFVGDVIGASEKITKGILDSTVGKVLVIDEAYGFYSGGKHNRGADVFKIAVIDTIVANVHSTPGDDRCILLLGYREEMRDMLENMNPGLSRRFPLKSAFVFEDFDPTQLATIFHSKLKKQGFGVTPKAEEVALQILERARNQPNFGNAGEVDIILDEAKVRHQKRVTAGKTKMKETLEALDFDEEYDRATKADVTHLFQGTVGCERVVGLLQGYQTTIRRMAGLSMDPKQNIPFNFLFRGPPGTGKTTTARKMGKVFYDAGILASDEVVEVSTSEIIGQYVGHTGPNVRKALDKALGKVLFIDEAYRLALDAGHFAQEALDEIVDACTKERYHKKLIIILAGYEKDINHLLTANSGLSSRFPEVIDFQALNPSSCLDLLAKDLTKKKTEVESSGNNNSMDIACLTENEVRIRLIDYLTRACQLEAWANARDVLTLSSAIFNAAIQASSSGNVEVTEEIAVLEIEAFVEEKEGRDLAKRRPQPQQPAGLPTQVERDEDPPAQPSASSAQSSGQGNRSTSPEVEDKEPQEKTDPPKPETKMPSIRDAGVSDEVWEQLQADIRDQNERDQRYQEQLRAEKKANDDLRQLIVKELIAEQEKKDEEHRARLRAEKKAIEESRRRIMKQIAEEKKKREEEAKMREKLDQRGLCPMGFQWIRQAGGWRCAGGSHWISDAHASML
ncbi:hypothetical protein NLU13_3656 [Sarocladium strictum]|uniref:AAA+ ATPase domain-containing protein n=1 Tax=Sarocladium strictum TaxID=5046 RepID=A0AA39GMF1_SARSR|nr:hypothetical protein NLU13_3656 [Sarocladium strictum]